VAGPAPPRPVDQGQTLWPGRRLRRPTRAAAAHTGPERHLQVDHPGQLVQLDCFCIGRLAGTKGTVRQDTAIHVASAYVWATLQGTRRNPSAQWTSALARTVAADLAERGWRLERVMSDNASEFRSASFGQTITKLGARHRLIRAGRPQTNGCVERVQQTILEKCWKPAFARYLIPSRPASASTSSGISATTTPNAPTPAAGPAAGLLIRSSARPSYGSATADASPQLEDRTA
jgi:transposase InsO family protein